MDMNLIKKVGQPLCIAFYVACIVLAFMKKWIYLVILFALHLCEFFITGRKTGKNKGYTGLQSLVRCLAFGFTWWLPLKKTND